jgi:outer membrane protein assembly factor BamB
MGNYVLVATDAGGLQAFGANGAVAWSATSPGKLAGAPLSLGGLLYCTTENGKVFRVSEQNGKSQPWGNKPFLDLGEPLGAGATPFGGKFLMLLGRDSTLHVAKIP